jgi:hypothetical protein
MHPLLSFEVVNQYGPNSLLVSMEHSNVLLDPEEVDALIEALGAYRSEMHPPVPQSPSRSHKYVIENNPTWHTEANPLLDGAVVFFRHSGFGWVGSAIPRASLTKLIEALSIYAGVEQDEACIR